MTTAAQVAANQANAKRSSGPRTATGKARSRANATKHNLAGKGVVRGLDEERSIDEIYREICEGRNPTNALQCLIIERIATHLTFLNKAEQRLATIQSNAAFLAEWDWDHFRRTMVQGLLEILPKKPHSVSRKLELSPQGCTAMATAWDALDGHLEKKGEWNDEQRSFAFDLLGVGKALRNSGRTELDPQPDDGTTKLSLAQEVARREMKRLQERAESEAVKQYDAMERQQIIEQRYQLETPEARLGERYRREHARSVQWYWNVLDELQRQPEEQPEAGDSPAEEEGPLPEAKEADAVPVGDMEEKELILELIAAGALSEDDIPDWVTVTPAEVAQAKARFEAHQREAAAKAAEAPTPKDHPVAAPVPNAWNVIPVSATPRATTSETPSRPMTRKNARRQPRSRRRTKSGGFERCWPGPNAARSTITEQDLRLEPGASPSLRRPSRNEGPWSPRAEGRRTRLSCPLVSEY